MKLKKGDNVQIIAGKDKGKQGTIEKISLKHNTVLIKGVNMVKKHIKKTENNPGGVFEIEKMIDASKVMFVDPKTKKPSRIGYSIKDGKKERVSKSSGQVI